MTIEAILLLAALGVFLAVSVCCALRSEFWINPVSLFICGNAIMIAGIVPLSDLGHAVDLLHLGVSIGGLMAFGAGAAAWRMLSRPSKGMGQLQSAATPPAGVRTRVVLWLSLCASITAYYYYLVGYNLFVLSIISLLTTGYAMDDVATLRLQAYAGQEYFAAGYFNQIKNSLFPAVFLYAFVLAVKLRSRALWLSVIIFAPALLLAIAGTGQRTFVVVVFMLFLLGISRTISDRLLNWYSAAWAGILGALLVLSTVALGREVSGVAESNWLGATLGGIAARVTGSNQAAAVVGFRYIAELPCAWGAEWAEAFLGILPGFRGSALSSDIFAVIYGGNRGTSPPSVWGSLWHNFRWLGFGVAVTIGALYQATSSWIGTQRYTLAGRICGAFITLILGSWIADSPVTILNLGLPGAVVFFLVFVRSAGKRSVQRDDSVYPVRSGAWTWRSTR
jgi:hypothetical protein